MSQPEHWYVLNVGDAMLAGNELARIKEVFQASHARAPDPDPMAIFIRHESEGQLHCSVTLYFSPATAKVAQTVNARPSQPPSPQDLGLFAGRDEAWSVLFDITQ